MQLSAKTIRLAVDVAKTGQPVIDLNTQQTPSIFAGTDVQVQLALFNNGALVDVGNLAWLQLDLKSPANVLGSSVLTQQVNASALNNACTYAQWTAGTAQQCVFALTNSQTNFAISAPVTYALIISGATTDSPGRIIVFGQSQFTVTPTGLNSGGSPPPATPSFYTASQSDGRYVQLTGAELNGGLQIQIGGATGATLAAEGASQVSLAAGQTYASGVWTAQETTTGLLRLGSTFSAYLNSGQTVNSVAAETLVFQATSSGTLLCRDLSSLDTPNLDAWGDSITLGNGASNPASTSYVALLASARGFTSVNNHGISGSQIQDEYSSIIAYQTSYASESTILSGYNDMRVFGASGTNQQNYEDGLLAALAWLAIPAAKKVMANAAATTGTWVATTRWGISTSLSAQQTGATMTFSASGDTVFVWATRLVTGGGSFSLAVDGTLYGLWNCAGAGTSNLGTAYSPFVARIANLPGGAHVVTITTTSSAEVQIDSCAGNQDANTRSGPNVYVGNCLHMNSSGYGIAPNSGSDAVVASLNTRIAKNCQLLCADGLNVVAVEASSRYSTSNVASDNIHPNDAGHQQIADAFSRTMCGFIAPRDRQSALCAVKQKVTRYGTLPSLWVVDTISNQIAYGVFAPNYFLDFRQPAGPVATLHLAADGNDDGVYLMANGSGPSALFGAGAVYNGSTWTAKLPAPAILDLGSGNQFRVGLDSGRTIGSSYTPTFILTVSAGGLSINGGLASGGASLNASEWINGSSGIQAQGSLPTVLTGVGAEMEYNSGTVYFSGVNRNSNAQIPVQVRGSTVAIATSGTTNLSCNGTNVVLNLVPKFAGTNTTGSGSASLGGNCPGVTSSAPYTWVQVVTSDGSTAFIPAWK